MKAKKKTLKDDWLVSEVDSISIFRDFHTRWTQYEFVYSIMMRDTGQEIRFRGQMYIDLDGEELFKHWPN